MRLRNVFLHHSVELWFFRWKSPVWHFYLLVIINDLVLLLEVGNGGCLKRNIYFRTLGSGVESDYYSRWIIKITARMKTVSNIEILFLAVQDKIIQSMNKTRQD